jgi:hypothetical protein
MIVSESTPWCSYKTSSSPDWPKLVTPRALLRTPNAEPRKARALGWTFTGVVVWVLSLRLGERVLDAGETSGA